jgi:outer membrane lipoprotein-sorting protein
MKYFLLILFLPGLLYAPKSTSLTAEQIIQKVDDNMAAKTRISTSEMVIYGKRKVRRIRSKSWSEGSEKSFTEYLSPAREKGTKMLKLEDRLWIYTPSTDRTIQLSGHMLRQSVMGSDLSYEDMMEDRELLDIYNAKLEKEEVLNGQKTYVLKLTAKVEDVSYYSRKIWVDAKYFVPLKEELFAKSGKMLKKTTLSEVKQFGKRWYPTKINYKDMLKDGKGTDFIILTMVFDVNIPEHIFSKAALKK